MGGGWTTVPGPENRRTAVSATRARASAGTGPRRMADARPAWSRRQRRLLMSAATASALILAVSGGLSAFFGHLNQDIKTQSMAEFGPLPPASKAGVLNILALGSQTRDGQGPGFGFDPGTDLSDTAMLIHLNAAHNRAIVLSIPRDLLVYRPACRERVGGNAIVPAEEDAMFDSAMNLGGPACAVATVQHMSGIRIDHFIRIDFNGFRTMTDVLGGVEVCVPRPGIHDWRSHLNISPGLHLVSGDEALAFVRDRHGIGNGGDLGRIEMQQMFVSSLIKKVMSEGTLTNPLTLYRIADAAAQSLTTDPGLGSVQALLGLAETLRGLTLKNITFVTLPNQLDPFNIDRLLPEQPQASQVWRLLREDLPWTGGLSGTKLAHLHRRHGRRADHAGLPAIVPGMPILPATTGTPTVRTAPVQRVAGDTTPVRVQTRSASASICSGLPTPNDLGGGGLAERGGCPGGRGSAEEVEALVDAEGAA
jgi:LCP family protein required for cell wall assembly